MVWKRALLLPLLASALLITPSAHAQASDEPNTSGGLPEQSEQLAYEVRFRGARVASIRHHLGCTTKNHRAAAMIATSHGMAEDIHSFHIRLDSFFTPDSVTPMQGRTKITEEGKTRAYKSTFTSTPAVKVEAKIFDTQKRQQRYNLPDEGHDLLSWMLHLRAANTRWEKGQTQSYYIWDGWKLVQLEAKIAGQQILETPHGKYKTWAVDVKRTRMKYDKTANTFKSSAEPDKLGTLWFTTGADHILVGMDFDSRIGMANIRLTRAEREPCKEKRAP